MKGQGRVESRSMSCIDSVWVWALSSDFGGHTYVEGSTAEEYEGALAHTVLLDVLHPKPYDLRLFRRASARPVSLGPVLQYQRVPGRVDGGSIGNEMQSSDLLMIHSWSVSEELQEG